MVILILPDGDEAIKSSIITKVTYSSDMYGSYVDLNREPYSSSRSTTIVKIKFKKHANREVDQEEAKSLFKRILKLLVSKDPNIVDLSEETFQCECTCETPNDES